jgi:hypothetical protein
MDNSMLNGLVLYKSKYFSGLVEEDMLSNALATRPAEVSPVISYLFGRFDQGSVIDAITGGLGRTLEIENREYEWNVMIEHDKAISIRSAKWNGAAIVAASTAGINGTPIQVWVSEKWFGVGAIVAFDDREFQARIMAEPIADGTEWIYTLQVVGDVSKYIPSSLLTPGKQLSREGSAYEEYSDEADIVNYVTPFKLRNHLTTMRMKYEITGSAVASVMVFEMRDPKSKKTTRYWQQVQEWEAMRQWFERTDRQLVYSQFNKNADGTFAMSGTNGRNIYIGAGLLQQIAPANKRYVSKITLDSLDEFLMGLSYNILGQGERKFLGLTGEAGMMELDRILREKASSYSLIDTKFITGSGQELTLGGQFTTYKGLNGIELTLKHLPLYDNTVYNRQLHPVSGLPLESYRMTFLNIGMNNGEANIQKVVRKGREMVMWHEAGSVAPGAGFAKAITTQRASGRDGYVVYFLSECGIMVKNPAACGEIIYDFDLF